MIEKKKVAVIAVAEYYSTIEKEVVVPTKVHWTDFRVGWHNKSRINWTNK